MTTSHPPYASLWRLSAPIKGIPLSPWPKKEAAELIGKLGLEEQEPSGEIDRQLRNLPGPDSLLGLLSLRCRASHVALWILRDLVAQCTRVLHQTKHDDIASPELAELASFIFDDEGRLDPDGPAAARPYTPFLLHLVRDLWEPSRGALPSFTRRAVKGHPEIKKHLLRSYGIAIISPWAFLASASSERAIQDHWHNAGDPSITTDRALALLRAYLSAYKKAKLAYRKRTGKSSGWLPDDAFWREVDGDSAPADTKKRLLLLVRFFQNRKYGPLRLSLDRTNADAGSDATSQSEPGKKIEPSSSSSFASGSGDPLDQALEQENMDRSGELADGAYRILCESITIPATYKPAQQRLDDNGERFLCVCRAQAKGRSVDGDAPQAPLNQRKIACDCHTSQPTVQRDLAILREWASEIAIVAIKRLHQDPTFQEWGTSLADTKAMVSRLIYLLLTPLVPGEEAPLCAAIAHHLNHP